jgi:hypothetical protein
MFELTLKTELIPDGTIVTKVGGKKTFTLQRKINLFAHFSDEKLSQKDSVPVSEMVKLSPDIIILMPRDGSNNFDIVDNNKYLTICFPSIGTLQTFVEEIYLKEQEEIANQ